MKTHTESLWLLAITSKSTPQTLVSSLLFLSLAYLAFNFVLYITFPGGPAWAKHHFRPTSRPIIPGPRGLPLVGILPFISHLAHRRLASTASLLHARRLMAFSLGRTRAIVTAHPDVAKEILQSPAFADRPFNSCARSLMFHRAIGFAPPDMYWRTLRRVGSTHLFNPRELRRTELRRARIAAEMVLVVGGAGDEVKRVRETLKRASLSHMMGCVLGGDYEEGFLGSLEEVCELVEEGYELLGKHNWSDHLPWLAGLDLQRIRFRCEKLVPRVNQFVSRIIANERSRTRTGTETQIPGFLHVLLALHGPDKLSDTDLVAVLWEMIFRGTDAVACLIEWVLARMVIHADVQSKVHEELDRVVGKSRRVRESDLSSMVYLPAVVKEVLRLHPPGPLLSWCRLAITDTTIDGYDVPAGTTGMVNMWAIMRDPQVWPDPLSFKPERFISDQPDKEVSVFGSDLRIAPFGSGMRSCPGKALGFATVNFWVATLLHEYEWGVSDQNSVDLSEVLRLSCEMANPLTAKVRRRR